MIAKHCSLVVSTHRRILHDAADVDVFFKQGAKVRIHCFSPFSCSLLPLATADGKLGSSLPVAGVMLPRGSKMLVSHCFKIALGWITSGLRRLF